jgi:predicted RNase H-like nuclease (RuvC/YqgF family)
MSDPEFFRKKAYADKRVKEETDALQSRIAKLETELKAKDVLIGELRAQMAQMESAAKKTSPTP